MIDGTCGTRRDYDPGERDGGSLNDEHSYVLRRRGFVAAAGALALAPRRPRAMLAAISDGFIAMARDGTRSPDALQALRLPCSRPFGRQCIDLFDQIAHALSRHGRVSGFLSLESGNLPGELFVLDAGAHPL